MFRRVFRSVFSIVLIHFGHCGELWFTLIQPVVWALLMRKKEQVQCTNRTALIYSDGKFGSKLRQNTFGKSDILSYRMTPKDRNPLSTKWCFYEQGNLKNKIVYILKKNCVQLKHVSHNFTTKWKSRQQAYAFKLRHNLVCNQGQNTTKQNWHLSTHRKRHRKGGQGNSTKKKK